VIARVWTAQAAVSESRVYATHFQKQVVPTLRRVAGYRGAKLLAREIDGDVELVVVTTWESLPAIQGFAGGDLTAAVIAPEAQMLLTRFDTRVRHYEVMLDDEVNEEER
jgi:heme-degrading monooxygenase HmoA